MGKNKEIIEQFRGIGPTEGYLDLAKIFNRPDNDVFTAANNLYDEVLDLQRRYLAEFDNRKEILAELYSKSQELALFSKAINKVFQQTAETYETMKYNYDQTRFYDQDTVLDILLRLSNKDGLKYDIKKVTVSQIEYASDPFGEIEYAERLGDYTILAPVEEIEKLDLEGDQTYREANDTIEELAKTGKSFAFIWNNFHSHNLKASIQPMALSFNSYMNEGIEFVVQDESPLVIGLKQLLQYSETHGVDFRGAHPDELFALVSKESISPDQKMKLYRNKSIINGLERPESNLDC